MKSQLTHSFEEIICLENLLAAWREFISGKSKKKDVQEFSLNLADNILQLHYDLKNLTYQHGGYQAFNISDPKPRNIHKATVRDRLLHHAIYRQLYPFFDIVIARSPAERDDEAISIPLSGIAEHLALVGLFYNSNVRSEKSLREIFRDCHARPSRGSGSLAMTVKIILKLAGF